MRLKANGEEIFSAILQHRLEGHGVRFKPAGAEASVYCFDCRKEIVSGDRQSIDECFESALQVPKGQNHGGCKHQFPSLE